MDKFVAEFKLIPYLAIAKAEYKKITKYKERSIMKKIQYTIKPSIIG